MARKTNEIGELARALKAPSFNNPDARPDLMSLDPVSPTTLILRVAEIKAYEHNPRLAENREYPRLKDSIRTRRGLTTPLTVTKRPGEDCYTIAAGGNSRLKALKELAEETGDDVFARATCRFEPWDSECQVFANHLIENDIRGTMIFGDKARAIVEWQRLYEESHPDEPPLSQRELVVRLAEAGYRLHRALITPLINTAELLLPHLPIAFGSGLGRPAAERLLRLHACCARYWKDALVEPRRAPNCTFDDLFAEVCATRDCHSADWDHELFQSALVIRIAQALRLDHKLVALDVDGLYHGHAVEPPEAPDGPDALPAKDSQALSSEWAFERARQVDALKRRRARARIETKAGIDTGKANETPSPEHTRPEPRQLREGNYIAARALAARHELDQFVRPIDTGLGFFIEAPEPSAVPAESRDRPTGPGQGLVLDGVRSGVWWLLCLAADQLVPAHLTVLGASHPASWLVELFTALPKRNPETDALAMLHVLVGEPTAHELICEVLMDPAITDEDLGELTRLVRGCRALRASAVAGSLTLWGTAP